jgi:hypothetical protein
VTRDMCAAKALAEELLDRVVATVTADRASWLATMMDAELHPQTVHPRASSAARS